MGVNTTDNLGGTTYLRERRAEAPPSVTGRPDVLAPVRAGAPVAGGAAGACTLEARAAAPRGTRGALRGTGRESIGVQSTLRRVALSVYGLP